MPIVVTAPAGNIGSKLVGRLLDAGRSVTLLTRNRAKVERFKAHGAKVEVGDLRDKRFVAQATQGASALFWLTPTDLAASDVQRRQREMGEAAADAIRTNRIGRVVNVSSMGAELGRGAGPVDGLFDVEKAIDSAAESVAHLRPGFFMENFLGHVQSLRQEGAVYLPISGKTRVPLIATRDIARVAADRLLDAGWSGRTVTPLQGPDTLSFDEAAETMSAALGWPLKHVQVPYERAREAMKGMGMSDSAVRGFLELYHALETGYLYSGKPEAEKVITETTFEQFAREVIKPAVQS